MPEIIVKLGDNVVQKYFFMNEPMRVGRAPDNEIAIENLAISRNHAMVSSDNGRYYVEDLGSSNGTFVNGARVKRSEIADRDVISIGKHKLFFYDLKAAREVSRRPSLADADSTMLVMQAPLTAEL